jgi:hypothetical protein
MKMEQTECSETSAYKIHTPGNYPEENIQQPSALFSWNHPCYHYQLKIFLVKAYTAYDSYMHFYCTLSLFLYIPLDNMSKSPSGRPMGMKCPKRNGVSLSIQDKTTLDKK